MKFLNVVLALLLAVCLLAGCTGQPAASVPTGSSEPSNLSSPPEGSTGTGEPEGGWVFPSIDKSYFDLICEDMDITYHVNNSGGNVFYLFFISARPMEEDASIQITTDQSEHVIEVARGEWFGDERINQATILSYQGFDWAAYAAAYEDSAAADALMRKYYGALNQVGQRAPRLYYYKLTLTFDDVFSKYLTVDGESREWKLPEGTDTVGVEELTVTFRGESKTYHPRNLSLTTRMLDTSGNGVIPPLLSGIRVDPSATGEFTNEIAPLCYKFQKAATLTGFAFPEHPESRFVIAKLKITPQDGRGFEMEWDGKTPVEIDDGSEVKMTLTWTEPGLAGSLGGTGMQYFALLYERDGEEYSVQSQVTFSVYSDAFAFYAQKYDGVDMTAYYRDFYPLWKEALE